MYNLVMGIHYIGICNLVHLHSREKQNVDQHGLWLLMMGASTLCPRVAGSRQWKTAIALAMASF